MHPEDEVWGQQAIQKDQQAKELTPEESDRLMVSLFTRFVEAVERLDVSVNMIAGALSERHKQPNPFRT